MANKKADKPLAFVIMPFSQARPLKKGYRPLKRDELDSVYAVLYAILAAEGYKVKRAESPTDILHDIIVDLDQADLVVADLTSLNPNVMYELGIRHGFCKKTILVTQDRNELPFDIAGNHCIQYGWVTEREKRQFREDIRHLLRLIDEHPDPRFGPVHAHLDSKSLGIADARQRENIRRLRALNMELGWLVAGIDIAFEELAKTFPNTVKKVGPAISFNTSAMSEEIWDAINVRLRLPFVLPAIDLLLSTAYIGEEYDSFEEIDFFMGELRTIRQLSLIVQAGGESFYSNLIPLLHRTAIHGRVIEYAVSKRLTGRKLFTSEIREEAFKEMTNKATWEKALDEASATKAKKGRGERVRARSQGAKELQPNPSATPDANRASRGRRR